MEASSCPGLGDGRLGRAALPEGMAHPANQPKGIQYGSMPGDEHIKKMPQSGQGLVLGGRAGGELFEEPAGQAGRDLVELQVLVLAPVEEPTHVAGVGGPSVGVGDPRGEELIGREAGRLAGTHEDGREGPFEVGFGPRIRGSERQFLISHNR